MQDPCPCRAAAISSQHGLPSCSLPLRFQKQMNPTPLQGALLPAVSTISKLRQRAWRAAQRSPCAVAALAVTYTQSRWHGGTAAGHTAAHLHLRAAAAAVGVWQLTSRPALHLHPALQVLLMWGLAAVATSLAAACCCHCRMWGSTACHTGIYGECHPLD